MMSTKTLIKWLAAFGILALVLIFLGVNYVPRISAFSSVKESVVDTSSQARSNYVNELYPRSIGLQLSYSGSDYFERHASQLVKSIGYTGSDFFERHSSELAKTIGDGGLVFLNHHPFASLQLRSAGSEFLNHHPFASLQLRSAGSEFLNHHPFAVTQGLSYTGSDWIERHPSYFYTNSDWVERQR
jgi:hypothetical protein